MFGEQETRLDIRFVLFGIPVRVSPFFWLTAILLSPIRSAGSEILIWVIVFFLSILLHELGHALMFRRYGYPPHIVLHGCGGYAMASCNLSNWRNIKVSAAGPAMNFAIAAVLWATNFQYNWADRHEYLRFFYEFGFAANMVWGLFNLLPIWPLDGGHICQSICYLRRVRDPIVRTLKISIGTALTLVVLGLLNLTGQVNLVLEPILKATPQWLPLRYLTWLIPDRLWILFDLLLAYNCYVQLQAINRERRGGYADDYGDKYPWQK